MYIKRNFNIVFFITIIFLWILVVFDTTSPDKSTYLTFYERLELGYDQTSIEIGYWMLSYYSVKLGLSFYTFIAIITTICIFLIGNSILRYSYKPEIVLIFYFCYPFLLDVTQLRHFIAVSIFVFSIRFLEKYTLKNLIKYLLCILLASTIHLISISFILYLLSYIRKDKIVFKISIITTLVMIFLVQFLNSSDFLQSILSFRDVDIRYEEANTFSSIIKYSLFYLFLIGSVIFLKRQNLILNYTLYKIALLSTIFVPTIIFNFQYTRLFRASCIIFYILIVNGILSMRNQQNKILWETLTGLLMIIIFIILFGPNSGYFEPLTKEIFNGNALFLNLKSYF